MNIWKERETQRKVIFNKEAHIYFEYVIVYVQYKGYKDKFWNKFDETFELDPLQSFDSQIMDIRMHLFPFVIQYSNFSTYMIKKPKSIPKLKHNYSQTLLEF